MNLIGKAMLETYKNKLQRALGAREQLQKQLKECAARFEALKDEEEDAIRARSIIQETAQETQQHLEYRISNLVTHALKSVFGDEYALSVHFVQKNNKTGCELLFSKGGEEYDPMESSGGGVLDVASFALRLAFWAMKPTAPVFILDEPFKFLSADKQESASLLLKSLSEKMGIQFIVVSHLQNLIASADNVIELASVKNVKKAKKSLKRKLGNERRKV